MKNALMLLDKTEQSDPRIELEPETLALAKRNAFPLVAQRTSKKDGMGLAVGAAGALLIGAATFFGMSGSRSVQPAKPSPATVALPQAKPSGVVLPPEALTQLPAAGVAPGVGVAPIPPILGDAGVAPQQLIPNAGINQHGAPALIVDSGPAANSSAGVPTGLSNDEAFAARVGNSGPEVAKATRMKNPGQTVSQGTLIPAVLETAINSDLAWLRPRSRQQRHPQLRRQPRSRAALVTPDRPVQERSRRRADPRLRPVDAAHPPRRRVGRVGLPGRRRSRPDGSQRLGQ